MKRSEMNVHQRAIFDILCEEMSEWIGGYENSMLDYDPEEEEYKRAEAFLNQSHEELVQFFYDNVMAQCKKGTHAEHARFAGGEFLKERIDRRLKKWGY